MSLMLKVKIGLWALVLMAAASAAAYLSGRVEGYNQADDSCRLGKAEAIASQERALRLHYEQQITDANAAVADLRKTKKALQIQAKTREKEIVYVTQQYRPAANEAARPLPQCLFTHGFVSLYNQSISTATLSAVDSATGADGTASAAAPAGAGAARAGARPVSDPLAPSGIRQSDILHHINGYGERCLTLEAQLNGLINYLEKQGRK